MSLAYVDNVSVFFQLLHTQDVGAIWLSHKDMGQSKCPLSMPSQKTHLSQTVTSNNCPRLKKGNTVAVK